MANIPDFPFSVQDLREEFDRMVDRVWHGGLSTAPLDGQDWAPRTDIYERPDGFLVRLEIPGVSADDVEVSLLKSILTVKGTKRAPQEITERVRRLRSECRFGSFLRKFELPGLLDEDSVAASSREGVLYIRISKMPSAVGRTVKVKSEDEPQSGQAAASEPNPS